MQFAGVSIPVDGGGLLTSWFNLDLQPRIAENGEDVVFGPDDTSRMGSAKQNGSAKEDYPVIDTGSRTVSATATSAVASRQSVRKLTQRPALRGSSHMRSVARSTKAAKQPRMCAQASMSFSRAFGIA